MIQSSPYFTGQNQSAIFSEWATGLHREETEYYKPVEKAFIRWKLVNNHHFIPSISLWDWGVVYSNVVIVV